MELLRGREQVAGEVKVLDKGTNQSTIKREYPGGAWSLPQVLSFVRCSYCRYIV